MNEEYLRKIYDNKGGQAVFGSFESYANLMVNDSNYRSKVYNSLGGEGTFGKYDSFENVVKKKEPTQAKSGSGSSQTQQSSGSQPSQDKDFFEQVNEIVSKPKTTLSQVEEVEAGTAAPAEFGLEGIRKVKGPSIEAVSESTAPKLPGYIQMAQQEAEKTQKPKDNIFEYKATPEEQAQIKTDKANRVAYAQEQKKAADANYNALNKELYDIYEGNDVTGIEAQLNKIETDYKNGAFAGKEDEYYALKTDLFNKRSNSYSQLENKYLDILKEDDPSRYKEYMERRAGILKDLNEAGYASWDDYQLKRDLNDQKTGVTRDITSDDSFDIVDKADQKFLRDFRMEAIDQVSVPNTTGAGNYIPGLGTGFTSAATVEKFHKDTQPIMSDYEALMNENAVFERDYQAGKYTPENAKAKYEELKLKEQGLATRLNQAKKESGVTDYDLQRYDLSSRKQGALGSTYNTGFKDLKTAEDYIRTEQENRQRWVAENPVLGTLTYFVPTVWKEFSNMAVVEGTKMFKPLGETFGAGEGYGWTDALYYGAKDFQESRDALYGYGGQDTNGDGVPDDLPGFAKYGQVLAQGLGSVGAFMIPGTYANNLFKGSSLGMRSARFATNWAGGFLMMEGPAYDEALKSGLSNEDAARSATLIATLQSAAEQLVPDIKYLEAPVTRAGIISMIKAGVPYDKVFSNGMKYLQDLSTSTLKSSFKEAGEEVVGQFATDVGKTISNDAFVRTTHFNMSDPMHPEYSTKPYDDTWELKNYTDAAIGGALTGGFMTGLKGATRVYTKNEMEALSYMGQNWKDILANIEKTESNGVNRGDDRFKEIEQDLKGVGALYQSLQAMPGFKDLTKANQDVVLSLAFRKKALQENVKNLGVELPSVKETLSAIDERINAYMTGQLDYGADKPVSYMDDNLAAMGVAFVSVNPDGTYNIEPKEIEGVKPEEILQKAEEYIKTSLKDTAFADSFYHPKTNRDAIQERSAAEILSRKQGETTEAGGQGQGMGPGVQGQKTTSKEEEVKAQAADIVSKLSVPNQLASAVYPIIGEVEAQMNNNEMINESKLNEAQDKLYEFLGDIDAREDLTPEQKKNMSEVIENRIQKLQDYDNRSRTETRTSTQTVATGVSPKTQKQNERAKTPIRTVAEEGIDVTYDGKQGKVELRDGNYVFVPKKLGAVQGRPIVIGEAAQVNGNSTFAGVENPTKGNNNSVANITLPNGVTLSILNDDLSIDVGLEIAKQEIGLAPQALFDAVFDEIVSEQKTEVPVAKEEAVKEEEKPTAEEPVAEKPTEEKPVEEEKKPAEKEPTETPNLFTSARKNALLAKFRNDSGKRALVSSIERAASAIRQAYGDVPIYVHETTAEMQKATAMTGGATMSRTGAGTFQYDANGNVIAVHVNMEKAGIDTAPHEFTHLILMDTFGDNPKLFKEFQKRILKALSASRIKELEAFVNQYTDKDVRPEEFMAQLAGLMTANREVLKPTTAQKIMNLINEFISRITKGKLIPFKANAQTKDLMDFFNTISSAMSTGQGGEKIRAAAEKAGSKFKTGKAEVEEEGSRDKSREQRRIENANSYKKYYIPNLMGGVSELTPKNYLAALKELLSTGSIENMDKYNPRELTEKQFPLNETNAQNPMFIKTNYDGWEKTVQFEIDGVEERLNKSKEAIVGQVGVETADDEIAMKDLEVARDMADANRAAQDIKSATGWEVGADGRWRYEYPDVELNDDIESDFDVLHYLQENAKKDGVRVRANEMYPPAPITDILDLGKLQDAYPYIDELRFVVNPDLDAVASFSYRRGLIEFGPEAIEEDGLDEFKRTLIHEIQHYIQRKEGFETGGSVSDEMDKFSKSRNDYKIPGFRILNFKNMDSAIKKAVSDIVEMIDNGSNLTEIANNEYELQYLYNGNAQAILKFLGDGNNNLKNIDGLLESDPEGAKKFIKSVIAENVIKKVAKQEYTNLAGEVEARNAEERSKIPYAERLYGKTLESTEEVARRNQILEGAKKAVSAMDVIAKKRGVAKAAEIKMQREILGENYDKAKQISDNFEDIAEKLGITKICGL